jgi:tetratricopeptide (TPR) repeat protein
MRTYLLPLAMGAVLAFPRLACGQESDSKNYAHFEKAQELQRQNKAYVTPEIIKTLRLQVEKTPEHSESHVLLGLFYYESKDYERGAESLEKGISLALEDKSKNTQEFVRAMLLHVECLLNLGQVREAKLALDKYWSFLQDAPTSRGRAEHLARASSEGIRLKTALEAWLALRWNGETLEKGYTFIVVDEENIEMLRNYQDTSIFLLPFSQKSDWATVIAYSEDPATHPSLAVYFEAEQPYRANGRAIGAARLPLAGEIADDATLEQKQELVRASYKAFPPDAGAGMAPLSPMFTGVELQTDNLVKFLGFQLTGTQ